MDTLEKYEFYAREPESAGIGKSCASVTSSYATASKPDEKAKYETTKKIITIPEEVTAAIW